MRVTRLEVFGFKSFLEKLSLPFDSGMTGVVGPNGCGKSNIVDALRWVLGETRASQLRGSSLEDVIFNGTDTLRPLGLAEVSMTLRATEKDFFAEILSPLLKRKTHTSLAVVSSEVPTVDPQTQAEGDSPAENQESEPVTNSEQATRPALTVIDGALSQTAEAASEIQVEVNQELKPSEIAAALRSTGPNDEGADDSEPDEQYLQQLMARYSWLKQVQEVQVTRRLYRSGESEFFINRVACRLRDLKELFRLVGLGSRSHTIVAQGEVGRIISARPEERRLILEEAAGVAGFRDKISAATRRLDETAQNLTRLDDVIKEVTRQVNSLRVQASRARNRQQLKDRLVELERDMFRDDWRDIAIRRLQAESQRKANASELERLEAEVQRRQAEEEGARANALSLDVEVDALRGKVDSIQEELRLKNQRKLEFSNRVASVEGRVSVLRQEVASLEERLETLRQRQKEGEQEIERLSERDKELVEKSSSLSGNHEELLRQLSAALSEQRELLRQQEQKVRTSRDQVVSFESRLNALREQISASSPVNQVRDSLPGLRGNTDMLNRLREFLGRVSGESKLLAEFLTVEPQYVRAVQAALGARASFLLIEDPHQRAADYNRIVQSLQQSHSDQKNSSPVVLGMLRAGVDAQTAGELPAGTLPEIRFLRSFVTADPRAQGVVDRLLDKVVVCETLEQAIQTAKGLEQSAEQGTKYVCVTRAGEIVTGHSVEGYGQERGVIAVKREADALDAQLTTAKQSYDELAKEREQQVQVLREREQAHAQALADSQRRQAEARELAKQQGEVRGRLQAEQRLVTQVKHDLAQLQINKQNKESQRTTFEGQVAELRTQFAEFEVAQQGVGQQAEEQLQQLRAAISQFDGKRQESRTALSQASLEFGRTRDAREKSKTKVAQLDFETQRLDIEVNSLRERALSELDPELVATFEQELSAETTEEATTKRLDANVRRENRDEINKIRTRIAREGEVDSTSIQRFEEEQKRQEDLTMQRGDLESAAKTLRHTIERLRKTSEERFVATFDAVAKNFSNLIPRLFGGGQGGLTLTDPTQPLDSGVDIAVRPPGKKLKSIELMSGGEKALCAIAMIVSMFLERPSPLCVLDEVDAPLDEANLVRFLSLIKDMSSKTQFLVVTHNKQTMSVSDRLIGVTMQQPGASKVVTVSLQEAYAHVA